METRTWKCVGCLAMFETYTRDNALTRKLCGRCASKGQNLTRIMLARREHLRETWARNERWEERKNKILGITK